MAGFMSNLALSLRSAAYKGASDGTNQTIGIFRDFWRQGGVTPLDKRGDTALHLLAIYGNVAALRALLQEGLVTSEDLKTKNVKGDTALHEAARFGRKEVAEIMLMKEKDLVHLRNELGETPLFVAAAYGKKEVFEVLEKFQSDCRMRRQDGCTILHAAVIGESYRLAISILESYPDLARKHDEKGMTALHLLATKSCSFRSQSPYVLRDLGRSSFVPNQMIGAMIYSCIPELYEESKAADVVEDPCGHNVVISRSQRSFFTRLILGFSWFKEIDDAKQKHTVALMLAKRLIRAEDWSYFIYSENSCSELSHFGSSSLKKNRTVDPLIQATKLGISEVAAEILQKYPEAVETFDEEGRNILHMVVEQKHRFLYDYLMKNVVHIERMMADVDTRGNTIVHFAANVGTPPNIPPGFEQQMIWDVFWLKRVQYDSLPHLWDLKNFDGMTAKELFEKKHAEVRKEAERTFKDMANSIMLCAVLIGTVNFAAIFTVPGGFDSKSGLPVLFKLEWWDLQLLMAYLGGGLVASLITMGTLLAILFSRFDTEDFYAALPIKHVIATGSMFYATGFTLVALLEAFILEDSLRRVGSAIAILFCSLALMSLVYIDIAFLMIDYMYYLIRYSFSYKGQET